MASDAQIVANRSNARKSTGPRTGAGKAVVAQNAVRHGLLAQQAVIRGEDPGQFEFYRDQMLGELAPAGTMESILAERAVGLAWRLRRAERIQAEVFDAMLAKDAGDGDLALGRAVVRDFSNSRVLDRLGLYERRIEHSLYRTMGEMQRLRLLRELAPPATEATPAPPKPTGDERSCETNPIPPVSEPKTQVESKDKAHLPGGSAHPLASPEKVRLYSEGESGMLGRHGLAAPSPGEVVGPI